MARDWSASPHQYLLDGFPTAYSDDVDAVVEHLGLRHQKGRNGDLIRVEGGPIRIPERASFGEDSISRLQQLEDIQGVIGRCLLSREHDGRVREQVVPDLAQVPSGWALAYVVALVGEAVIEIHEVVASELQPIELGDPRRAALSNVVGRNPGWWSVLQKRVVSYWAAYYRSDHPMEPVGGFARRLPDSYPAARAMRWLEALDGVPQLDRPLRSS